MVEHRQAHPPGVGQQLGAQHDADIGTCGQCCGRGSGHCYGYCCGQGRERLLGGVLGVLQQVVQHLAQLFGVAQHAGDLRVKFEVDGHGRGFVQMHHIGHQRVQVHGFEHGGGQARVVAEIVDQALHRIHLVHNGFD